MLRRMEHLTVTELEQALDAIRRSPADEGRVELIVRRPAVNEREVLEEGQLDPDEGLVLKPAFVERLRRSLQQPHDTYISSEEVLRRFGGGKAK